MPATPKSGTRARVRSSVSTLEQRESNEQHPHGVESKDHHPGPRRERIEFMPLRRDYVGANAVRQESPQIDRKLIRQHLDDERKDEEHPDEGTNRSGGVTNDRAHPHRDESQHADEHRPKGPGTRKRRVRGRRRKKKLTEEERHERRQLCDHKREHAEDEDLGGVDP